MDIDVFNFVKRSISGGMSNSINPYEKIENDNQSIVMMDIASQYLCETAKKYRFEIIDLFRDLMKIDMDKNKNHNCILLCNVKTTDKIRNDLIQKQIPMLYSKIKITDKNLSKYQLDQIREKRKKK